MEYLLDRIGVKMGYNRKENKMFYLYRIGGTIIIVGGVVGLLICKSGDVFDSLIYILVGIGYFGISCLLKKGET